MVEIALGTDALYLPAANTIKEVAQVSDVISLATGLNIRSLVCSKALFCSDHLVLDRLADEV